MTDWTEPDHADEEWVQPWEEIGGPGWPEECAGPEYWFAKDRVWIHEMTPYPDGYFFSDRPRWVSDRE